MNFLQNGDTNIFIAVVVAIYFIGLFYISFLGFKKSKTFSDFTLGGRSLNAVSGAMNTGSSDMNRWLFMGLPGMFYMFGLNQIWVALGLIVSSYISWKIMAPRLRKYSEIAGDSLTISSFLQNRFNDKSGILSSITAIIILLFSIIYIAAGFASAAKLFSAIFHISYGQSLIISSVIISSYALLGGFLAVNWINLLQGAMMLAVLVVTPIFAIYNSEISLADLIFKINFYSHSYLNPLSNLTWGGILGILSWSLGYFGQPLILTKYMAIKDVQQISKSRKIYMCWMFFATIAAAITGLLGLAYFDKISQAEIVFITMSFIIFHPIFVGLIIAVILAAIMCTLNSQIIICCSLLSENFYQRFIRKNAAPQEILLVARLGLVVIAAIAVVFAMNSTSSVLYLATRAWSGLGATIGPVILFSLFWKKTTTRAAIAGVISGAFGVIIFSKIHFFAYEIFPAFLLSSLLILIVSLLDKKQIPAFAAIE